MGICAEEAPDIAAKSRKLQRSKGIAAKKQKRREKLGELSGEIGPMIHIEYNTTMAPQGLSEA